MITSSPSNEKVNQGSNDQPTSPSRPHARTAAAGFNKREFGKLVAARFGVTQEIGMLFFDEVGQRMGESLAAGETVFLFGQGTLKVVRKRGAAAADVRTRFRPTTRTEKASAITLEGLPGVAAGAIRDVVSIGSVSAGDRAIQAGRACTAQGSGGSLVVYQDDRGQYRGILHSAGGAPAEAIMGTKKAAKEWLRDAFPATQG